MSNIQSLNKNLYDKYDNRYIKRDEYSGGSAENTTYSNTASGLTSTNVQGAIDELKSENGFTLSSTLTAGQTTLTFSDTRITTNSILDSVYTSIFGVAVKTAEVTNGSLTLTFKEQTENITVKVVIK